MKASYDDIIKRLGKPLWWDEHGVPRYDWFDPPMASNIYAKEVLLMRIRCQRCGAEFDVCLSWSLLSSTSQSLMERVRMKFVHYGDPPNIGCCDAGPTMNSEPVRILEFWLRNGFEWVRIPDLEVEVGR